MPQPDWNTINAQLASDPQWQQLQAGDPSLGSGLSKNLQRGPIAQMKSYLASKGIQVPQGYWVSNGKIEKAPSVASQVWDAVKVAAPVMAGMLLAPGIGGALGAGAGGAAGGVGIGETGAVLGLGAPGVTKVGTSIWDIIAAPLISAGTGIAGTVINNKANKDAAQIAADAARSSQLISDKATQQALGVQTQEYNTSRADTAPYRQAGSGAVNRLSYLAGVPGYTSPTSGNTVATQDKPITVPDIQNAGQPASPQATSLSTLGQPQAQSVKVKTPDGRVVMIPPNMVQEATQRGGQVLA